MRFIPLLAILLLLASCDKDDDVRTLPAKDLTYIVYMAADNSLSGNVESNLRGIEAGLRAMDVAINTVAFVDVGDGGAQLVSFTRDDGGSVTREVIGEYGDVDAVDPDFMADVIAGVAARYPSQHYVLDLWSHGMGWLPASAPSLPFGRWFGQDGQHFMDIRGLRSALAATGLHFDFLMFDACLMATVEVAYELRGVADYIVASPIEVWEMGFPYNSIMPALQSRHPEIAVAEAYAGYYDGAYSPAYGIEMTGAISVIDCAALDSLAGVTRRQLADVAPVYDETFVDELLRYDRYTYHYLYDFGDYMTRLLGADDAAPVIGALGQALPFRYATDSFGYGSQTIYLDADRYTGLGSYVPRQSYTAWNEYYKTLQWFEDIQILPIY